MRALQGTKIQRLAAGMTCSGAVDDEGNVYTMGYGRFWQLGLGHDRDQPTPAKVGVKDRFQDKRVSHHRLSRAATPGWTDPISNLMNRCTFPARVSRLTVSRSSLCRFQAWEE